MKLFLILFLVSLMVGIVIFSIPGMPKYAKTLVCEGHSAFRTGKDGIIDIAELSNGFRIYYDAKQHSIGSEQVTIKNTRCTLYKRRIMNEEDK